MLEGTFYTALPCSTDGTFDIALNGQHPIFGAHFPGKPIVPGVCILQICEELTERICNNKLTISYVRSIKFMHMLSPIEHQQVRFVLRTENHGNLDVTVQATVEHNNMVFTKIHMTLCPSPR